MKHGACAHVHVNTCVTDGVCARVRVCGVGDHRRLVSQGYKE